VQLLGDKQAGADSDREIAPGSRTATVILPVVKLAKPACRCWRAILELVGVRDRKVEKSAKPSAMKGTKKPPPRKRLSRNTFAERRRLFGEGAPMSDSRAAGFDFTTRMRLLCGT
jgi:hypothetical protein